MPPMPDTGAELGRLSQWRAHMFETMSKAGLDSPELDTRLLLCHGLELSQTDYFSDPQRPVDEPARQLLQKNLERRLAGEPVSRIVGYRAFWKHEFRLGSQTLDPRADSETLVETALELVGNIRRKQGESLRILDLGTGSGALLISLILELPDAVGVGVDISEQAIEVARGNAERLQCGNRIKFLAQSWLDGFLDKDNEPFDLIVCNPPYIPHDDIDGLAREVAVFDPRRALDGGIEGLDPYKEIIPQLHTVLSPSGIAVFEIGEGQHVDVLKLFDKAGFCGIGDNGGCYKDLAGVIRCLATTLATSPATGTVTSKKPVCAQDKK